MEVKEFIARINDLRPDIIWVGISAPKRERFMNRYLGQLGTTLMSGVGAACEFHTGDIADCSLGIKIAGLQWPHCLLQDPNRLWKRYLRNNPAFLLHVFLQLFGLEAYLPPPRPEPHGALPQPMWSVPRSAGR